MTTFQRARSEEQREARRAAILETAAEMLEEMSVADLTLNELARRVGLAKSNVLRYFESREAVLLELLDRAEGRWLADLPARLDAEVSGVPNDFDPGTAATTRANNDSGTGTDPGAATAAASRTGTGTGTGSATDSGSATDPGTHPDSGTATGPDSGTGTDPDHRTAATTRAGTATGTTAERCEQLAAALASSLEAEPVLCDLLSAQAAVLERNISTEVALRHKRAAAEHRTVLTGLIRRHLPEVGEAAEQLCRHIILVTGAIGTHAHPAASVIAAYEADPAIGAFRIDFTDYLRTTIATLAAGTVARAAC